MPRNRVVFSAPSRFKGLKIKLSAKESADALIAKLEQKFASNDPDSPAGIMKDLGEATRSVVVKRYAETRSVKNQRRRTGDLRLSLYDMAGPTVDKDSVKVTIAPNMPPHWVFAEYGIKPTTRRQTYQVVGSGSYNKKFPTGAISSSQYAAFREASSGQLKLIARKKEELARIRRKITLEFVHPGYKGGFFLRQGVIFATTDGLQILDTGFQRMFDNLTTGKEAAA